MAGKKILFLDLDGTLLNDDKTISEKNKESISVAVNAGNYIVIATGRPVQNGRKVVRELGLDFPGCYMIAFNGGVIYDCSADKVLAEKTMAIEDVEYLFQRAREDEIYIQTYTKNYILTEKCTQETRFYLKNADMSYKTGQVRKLIEDEPNKVLLIDLKDRTRLEAFQKKHAEWAKGRCESFFSSQEYLEYCPKGINKGWGVDYIREFLNISHEDTVAVGDEENDISMLKRAFVGVAMKNAKDHVKAEADYVTEHTNNEDAIAEIIEKYIL